MNIVIAGAGPIGLYTAIRLKQMGVENVTVLDPRAGEYLRPGDLDNRVFERLTENTGTPITPSLARHIKDAERGLYKVAEELGVEIHREKCIGLIPNGIKVVDEKKNEKELSYDLLLDCSGPSRALVQALNAQTPYFKIEQRADNPIKSHFFANVEMNAADISLVKGGSPLADPVSFSLGLEKLRSEFNWPHFNKPTIEFRPIVPKEYLHPITNLIDIDKLKSEPSKRFKVNIYCETPSDLPEDQRENWIKAILGLQAGASGKDIEFSHLTSNKAAKKPRFLPVNVDPHHVTPILFSGDNHSGLPPIIPLGDALANVDYRLGIGVMQGVENVDIFLRSLQLSNEGKVIGVDFNKYFYEMQPAFLKGQKTIASFYETRRMQLDQINFTLEKCDEALSVCTDSDSIKQIKHLKNDAQFQYAIKKYERDLHFLHNTLDGNGKVIIDSDGLVDIEAVKTARKKLFETFTVLNTLEEMPSEGNIEKEKVSGTLAYLAWKLYEAGRTIASYGNVSEGLDVCSEAMKIYKKLDPKRFANEQLIVLSELTALSHHQQNNSGVMQFSNAALAIDSSVLNEFNKNECYGKIFVSRALVNLDRINSFLSNSGLSFEKALQEDRAIIQGYTQNVEQALKNLETNPTIPPDYMHWLKEQYQSCTHNVGINAEVENAPSIKRHRGP